jgi:hypothetical protein
MTSMNRLKLIAVSELDSLGDLPVALEIQRIDSSGCWGLALTAGEMSSRSHESWGR